MRHAGYKTDMLAMRLTCWLWSAVCTICLLSPFCLISFSLLDRRGFVVPDSSQTHVSGPETRKERESNSVNVRHEYYGSTTVTNQKVRQLSTVLMCTSASCLACLPHIFPVSVLSAQSPRCWRFHWHLYFTSDIFTEACCRSLSQHVQQVFCAPSTHPPVKTFFCYKHAQNLVAVNWHYFLVCCVHNYHFYEE